MRRVEGRDDLGIWGWEWEMRVAYNEMGERVYKGDLRSRAWPSGVEYVYL